MLWAWSWILAAAPLPALSPGDELVYSGSTLEENVSFSTPYRRGAAISVRYFVLESRDFAVDLAALTLIRAEDNPGISRVVSESGGTVSKQAQVHLALLRLAANGDLRLLLPHGAPPYQLNETTPTLACPPVPRDALNLTERGPFLDRTLAWLSGPAVVIDGATMIEQAVVLPGRHERVWLSPADGVARIVWRRVEQQHYRLEVRLDLQPGAKPLGEATRRYRREIELAWHAMNDTQADSELLRQKLRLHKEESPATPYRPAIEAALRRLDK